MKNKLSLLLVILSLSLTFTSCKKRTKTSDSSVETVSSETVANPDFNYESSSVILSTNSKTIKRGETFMLTITSKSKYSDKLWAAQSVFVFCTDYDQLEFVKWKIPDMSDEAEDVMGEKIFRDKDPAYYMCGISYDGEHSTTKKIVYNVYFKLLELEEGASGDDLTQIGFYLRPNIGNIHTYRDGSEERKKEISCSHLESCPLYIAISA